MSDGRLKSFVERIARLHLERQAISADITEVVSEAKSEGYIPKTLRKVVARYLADPAKLAEDDALLETYEAALGRVGRAMAAVREGATLEDAAKANGIHRATLARARAVAKSGENATVAKQDENATPCPETGEIEETADLDTRPGEEPGTAEVTSSPAPAVAMPEDDLAFPPHLDRRAQATA